MKHIALSLTMLIIITYANGQSQHPETKLGWKLGAVSYNFKNFTFWEALDKFDSCKLTYIEGFPGHVIGEGVEGKLDYHMNEATRKQVQQRLKQKGLVLYAYGVVTPKGEADWRQLFEFGKAMGIKTFTSEPEEKDIPLISKLCDQYQINVAIHNHSYPTHYWSPDVVLKAIQGQSKRIGSCADIAHWVESGLDPIECLKKLEGHVLHSHLADLDEKNKKEARSVPWGTGVVDIAGVINELKRQHFNGQISAEYEYNWYNSVPDIRAGVIYFRKMIAHP